MASLLGHFDADIPDGVTLVGVNPVVDAIEKT
jgi:hypothetical protein